MVRKRFLGKTKIQVSELAFGGVEIGMPYGIASMGNGHMVAGRDAIRLLQGSLAAGINFFDTARLYGQSENLIGKAFKDCRRDVVIATKCRHVLDEEGNIPSYDRLKALIDSSWQESLTALQTEYIDIFMMHEAGMSILDNEDIAGIFAKLKQQGVIHATGISTYTAEETKKAIESGNWDVIQLPFNLLNQEQADCFAEASRRGIGIVVRSVLMKGLLGGKPVSLHPALKKVENHIQQYHTFLNNAYTNLPALAIRFALSYPEVAAVLIGIDKPEYLSEALKATESGVLDRKTLSKIKELAYPEPEFLNLAEWNKKGWLA